MTTDMQFIVNMSNYVHCAISHVRSTKRIQYPLITVNSNNNMKATGAPQERNTLATNRK